MALNSYSKVGWQNSPAQTTPVNATNLNKMDDQLYDVTEHLINLDASDLPYDNTVSGMTATTMQTAIDEVYKPTFSQALTRANINSGESIPTLFGKIKKFFADLKTVAFSGAYADLTGQPTIGNGTLTIQKNGTNVATFTANQTGNATANITVPTVNNGKLTIQKNGTNVGTFTADQSGNSTVNITVPTKVSDLNNDSGFITNSGSCAYATNAGYATSAGNAGTVGSVGIADIFTWKRGVPSTNCNNITDTGWYYTGSSSMTNAPVSGAQYAALMVFNADGYSIWQIWLGAQGGMYMRTKAGSPMTWSSWYTIH